MALALGAATAGNFALFHAEPVDPRSGEPEAAIFCLPYGILVNHEGRRFVDEARGPVDAWYERTTRDIQAQPHGIAWVLLDQPPVTAATLEELAARIDVPADALATTVAAYNAACGDGPFDHSTPDGLATTGLTPPRSHWAHPVAEARSRPTRSWPPTSSRSAG